MLLLNSSTTRVKGRETLLCNRVQQCCVVFSLVDHELVNADYVFFFFVMKKTLSRTLSRGVPGMQLGLHCFFSAVINFQRASRLRYLYSHSKMNEYFQRATPPLQLDQTFLVFLMDTKSSSLADSIRLVCCLKQNILVDHTYT